MLFKNDQKYDLSKDDYKAMAQIVGCSYEGTKFKEYPKGGVYIIPPKPQVHKNPDGTTALSKPAFHIIPYEQNIETTEGTVKWNYCVRPPSFKAGETPIYSGDQEKLFSHRFAVQQNQSELLFFLCCISKCGAHVEGANVVSYQIENKKKEADASINTRMQKVEVEAHILHPITGMHISDITRIAMAMKVENVIDLTANEIRKALLDRIESMEASVHHNGYKTFLEFTDTTSPVGSRTDLLAGLQMLKDKEIIKYHGVSNKWITQDKNGKKTGTICSLSPGKDKDESLEHHAMTDPEIGELVAKLIKEASSIPNVAAEA